jgi:hypothetical protein
MELLLPERDKQEFYKFKAKVLIIKEDRSLILGKTQRIEA